MIVRGGEGVSKTAGDETMARKYDDDIMAEFSKIERMISEQVRLQTRTILLQHVSLIALFAIKRQMQLEVHFSAKPN